MTEHTLFTEDQESPEYLFTEVEDFKVEMITETTKSGDKKLYVEGIAMQAETLNGNGRVYPTRVMAEAVEQYNINYVSKNQALGECDHPPRPNVLLAEASHLIQKTWTEGNNVCARAIVLDGHKGRQVRALIEGGWTPTVSTRGLGKAIQVNESKSRFGRGYTEITKFQLTAGFDFVHNQSAPGAVMAGVYESVGHQYIPVSQKESVDWNRVAFRMKQLMGVSESLIMENTNPAETGLKLTVVGNTVVIEANAHEWKVPLKELKKYLG